jgi:hypothetical protein
MSAMRAVPVPEETPRPQTYTAKAYAAQSSKSGMAAFTIPRRTPLPKDVQIEILYCGICHTDLHFVRNEFENSIPTTYPCVPGHEIIGRVVKTGSESQSSNPATWLESAAWSIPIAPARSAAQVKSNTAQ